MERQCLVRYSSAFLVLTWFAVCADANGLLSAHYIKDQTKLAAVNGAMATMREAYEILSNPDTPSFIKEDLDQEFYISMTPVVTAFWHSVKTLARGHEPSHMSNILPEIPVYNNDPKYTAMAILTEAYRILNNSSAPDADKERIEYDFYLSMAAPLTAYLKQVKALTKACPSGWYRSGTGTCYQFVDTQTDWESARSACQLKGADLAQITSRDKAHKMKIIRANDGKANNFYWVGAKQVAKQHNSFIWIATNEEFDSMLWGEGEPQNTHQSQYQCVNVCPAWEKMDMCDKPCTNAHAYICEKMNIH